MILEIVRQDGPVSLQALSEAVGSSVVTVRRDLRALEEQGLLSRRRGGAALPPTALRLPGPPPEELAPLSREKIAIAALAAKLVDDGDAVILGAGTTTRELARQLTGRRELTVVTNSLLVGEALAESPGIEVVMTGGSLRGSTLALVGSSAEKSLDGLRVRLAFLSGDGLTLERGLSTNAMLSAGVDGAIANAARDVVVLADRRKIGVEAMFQTVPAAQITHLVTDRLPENALVTGLTAVGVHIHVAPADGGDAEPGPVDAAAPQPEPGRGRA